MLRPLLGGVTSMHAAAIAGGGHLSACCSHCWGGSPQCMLQPLLGGVTSMHAAAIAGGGHLSACCGHCWGGSPQCMLQPLLGGVLQIKQICGVLQVNQTCAHVTCMCISLSVECWGRCRLHASSSHVGADAAFMPLHVPCCPCACPHARLAHRLPRSGPGPCTGAIVHVPRRVCMSLIQLAIIIKRFYFFILYYFIQHALMPHYPD